MSQASPNARSAPFTRLLRRIHPGLAVRWDRWTRRLKVALASDPYAAKEDYVAANPDVAWWDAHLNGTLMKEAADGMVPVGRVLDLGCNHGANSILLARQGYRVTGVDLNERALEAARDLAAKEAPEVAARLDFLAARFEKLPLPDAAFEGAFMIDVIEHLYPKDREAIFTELRRVLKPGACFLVVTPYEHAYDDGVQHVAFFDEASLASVLSAQGFTVLSVLRDRRTDAYTPEGHDRLNALLELPR